MAEKWVLIGCWRSRWLAGDQLTFGVDAYGDFKDIFSRQVRAHARPGDVVVGISTSGKGPNVVQALEVGRALGAVTIAFTGRNGGPVAQVADHCFKAPD